LSTAAIARYTYIARERSELLCARTIVNQKRGLDEPGSDAGVGPDLAVLFQASGEAIIEPEKQNRFKSSYMICSVNFQKIEKEILYSEIVAGERTWTVKQKRLLREWLRP
jgi:hypothetical protein